MLHPDEEVLAPVNIEAKIISYLNEELQSYPWQYGTPRVSLKPPRSLPDTPQEAVSVMAVGGTELSRNIFQSGLVVNCYARNASNAFQLARVVAGVLRLIPLKDADIVQVEAVGTAIVANDSDSDEIHQRFQNFIVLARNVAI